MAAVTTEQLATPPFDETIGEGETIIGEALPEPLIRLWHVMGDYAERASKLGTEHKAAHKEEGDHGCEEFRRQMEVLMNEGRLLKSLFWQEIRDEFPATNTVDAIALRTSADGKPVLVSVKQQPELFNFGGITIFEMGDAEGPSLRDIFAGRL